VAANGWMDLLSDLSSFFCLNKVTLCQLFYTGLSCDNTTGYKQQEMKSNRQTAGYINHAAQDRICAKM
jgi:hypothetical protein